MIELSVGNRFRCCSFNFQKNLKEKVILKKTFCFLPVTAFLLSLLLSEALAEKRPEKILDPKKEYDIVQPSKKEALQTIQKKKKTPSLSQAERERIKDFLEDHPFTETLNVKSIGG